jgi:SynChlorMet cassette radical SAM/SPASM protein ScmF
MTPAQTPPLNELYIYATDLCNCSCKHCWIVPARHPDTRDAVHFLTPETFEGAVLEAKPLGLRTVKWTGGEPTIHPDFPELLRIQKAHDLKGRLETNGLELTPELARLLRQNGVIQVSVSLDGSSPQTHDAIRGVRGAHQRALSAVHNLVEAGFKPQLIMSLMTDNASELEGLLALAKEVGAGSVKLNIVQPTLRGEDIHASGAALSVPQFLDLNRRLDGLRSLYSFPIFFDVPMAFRPLKQLMAWDSCSICGIKTILGLLADGSYALCGIGENLPELVFGRAGIGELERIWKESPALLRIRDGLPGKLNGICGRCLLNAMCLGSCVAQNYYRSKDLLGAFWFCEQAEEAGLFPESRLIPERGKR